MKNRRLTIFCVALVVLAGTPRAWQEASRLLAAVQHKAQVRFWSLVLPAKASESANLQLLASAQHFETNARTIESTCPLESGTKRSNLARGNSTGARRAETVSFQSEGKAEREVAPLSHTDLIAKALKAPRGDSHAESSRHSRSMAVEARLSELAENHPALVTLEAKALAPLPPAAFKDENFKFVVMPVVSPSVATALIEKENVMRLRVLRKAIEEPKTIRQKTRIPVVRGTVTYFPAS